MRLGFIYIMANAGRDSFLVGNTTDIIKTLDFYERMPNLLPPPGKLLSLVFIEEYETVQSAEAKFYLYNKMHNTDKVKIIEGMNPNWVDITKQMLLHG